MAQSNPRYHLEDSSKFPNRPIKRVVTEISILGFKAESRIAAQRAIIEADTFKEDYLRLETYTIMRFKDIDSGHSFISL